MQTRMPTNMEPDDGANEEEQRQSFVRQVQDRALQAAEVLREQPEGEGPGTPVRLFVP